MSLRSFTDHPQVDRLFGFVVLCVCRDRDQFTGISATQTIFFENFLAAIT